MARGNGLGDVISRVSSQALPVLCDAFGVVALRTTSTILAAFDGSAGSVALFLIYVMALSVSVGYFLMKSYGVCGALNHSARWSGYVIFLTLHIFDAVHREAVVAACAVYSLFRAAEVLVAAQSCMHNFYNTLRFSAGEHMLWSIHWCASWDCQDGFGVFASLVRAKLLPISSLQLAQ